MSKESDIAKILAKNIEYTPFESTTGTPLFFDEFALAKQYAELFNIVNDDDLDKFKNAFKVATEGQGGEIAKINSLISSALLPLLVFFRLFKNTGTRTLKLKIPGFDEEIIFNKCFYEVRNEVIKFPSCVDVVLYSSPQKVMLFLESKFTEIYSLSTEEKYGKGYIDLYKSQEIYDALSPVLEVSNNDKNLILTSQQPCYIEGIKQTISHLIGLVRGPKSYPKKKYPAGYSHDYYSEYKLDFDNSEILYYGTILFDPKSLCAESNGYKNYAQLYQEVIGKNGAKIISSIKAWDSTHGKKSNHGKEIRVLDEPITYQDIFSHGNNLELLSGLEKIIRFYQLR